MVARNKVAVGSFTLLKEHPRIPDGPCQFYKFAVNGEEVEVSQFVDSDLVWERTFDRKTARNLWTNLLNDGFRED